MCKWIVLLFLIPLYSGAQEHKTDASLEELKKEILQLQTDVNTVQLNLKKSHQKFKRGILAATIGYSVTITGGLMLGRKNDDLGQALLIAGGATGITGTILMVDAFKYLERAGRKNRVP